MRLTIHVAQSGADYMSIQEAVNAVPYGVPARLVIHEGHYKEKLFSDKKDLEVVGEGNVVIEWDDAARTILADGIKRGTFRTYTAFFSGEELRLENLTFINSAGKGEVAGQALALYLDVLHSELVDVRLIAHQDTLFLAPLPDEEREPRGFYGPRHLLPRTLDRVHVRGGEVHGGVDFIFGGADALFEDVDIYSNEPGWVTAPSGRKDDIGLVFKSCRFHAEGVGDGSCHLMRPWRKEGKAAFVDCTFGPHIQLPGFTPWPGREDEAGLASFHVDDDEARRLLSRLEEE